MQLIVMFSINSYSNERVCGWNVPVRNMSCIHVQLLNGQTDILYLTPPSSSSVQYPTVS